MPNERPVNRLSMEVDPEAIDGIIRETVTASIATALQKQGLDFHEVVVAAILDAKVDNDGKVIPRDHYNWKHEKRSWFDHQLEGMLRECAKKALAEFVEQQSPKIQEAMFAAFKKRTPQIVKAMTDGTIKAFTDRWGFRFDVKLERQDQ